MEKGCTVIEGEAAGDIPAEQYEDYLKISKELQHFERNEEQDGNFNTMKRWKSIS